MTVQDPPAGVVLRLPISRLLPRLALVLGGFTLLTALLFQPWLAQLSSALIGPPEDNMQDFWNSWHVVHAQGWHDLFFTRAIRFPEGTSLTYHSFAWPQVFVVALLARLFGNDFTTIVTLQNLTLLASFPLAAAAMFYLARHLLGEGRDLGAAVAGFIFAFNPWHVAQVMHHAHVSGIEFLPLFVLFYLRAEKDWRWLAGAAVMQALSALSCWYFLFYTLYFFAFHLLYRRIHDGRWPRRWTLAAPVPCTMGAALLLSPWLVPMLAVRSSLYYVGGNMFVADLAALIAFPPTHLLAPIGHGIYAAITGNAWEGAVYLGLVNLALLVWALTRPKTEKPEKRLLAYALGGAAFFLVIAAGEALHVAGHVTPLHLPGVILSHLPFFANVRTPARAMVMVFLLLGLALGYAVTLLRHRNLALTLVAVLMLLDFVPVHLASTPAACPPALVAITADPEPAGVLDLPRGYGEGNAAMMLAACHGHPIVAGETARQMGMTLLDRLQTRDLAAQKRQLTVAHVKYVILHRPQGELFHWNKANGPLADYPHIYRGISADRDLTVLRVY